MLICFSCQERCDLRDHAYQTEQEDIEITEQDFIDAVCTGDLAITQVYMMMHPEVVQLQKGGDTLLHMAIDCCHESIVRYLLRIGVDSDMRNSRGETPLQNAVLGGHFNLVQALIEHKEKKGDEIITMLNQKSQWGRTALFLAVDKGYMNIVEYLLSHGAQLSGDGDLTPLARALYRGSYDVASLLRRYGDELENVPLHLMVHAQRARCLFPWLPERRAYEADVEAFLASDDICKDMRVPKDLASFIVSFIRASHL